jgi:Rho GDP-dissociation inhibitor
MLVELTHRVEGEIVSGLKYLQVVKRAGMTVDKTEAMLGSYGPQQEEYTKIVSAVQRTSD